MTATRADHPPAPGERWIVLAAASRDAAERFARGLGVEPAAVLTRSDLRPGRLRALGRRDGVAGALVHTLDWQRQPAPQVFELALAGLPVKRRLVADESDGSFTPLDGGEALRLPLRIAAELAVAGRDTTRELRRFRREGTRAPGGSLGGRPRRAVLAIWIGEAGNAVGGSITHVSGVLSGFRAAGLRVGLVTTGPPPDQLAGVVDDLEIAAPLAPGSRAVSELQRIADNVRVREAGIRLARRLQPDFVYQRHRPFLVAGADVAAAAGVPLVLEWNASEAWKRHNWEPRGRTDFVFDGLLERMERAAVSAADLVVAVSARAAEMALDSGAPADRVVTVPNAVAIDPELDLEGVPLASGAGEEALVGWIGSFGPWHGAEVLVEALAKLPAHVRLRMIGDGSRRQAARTLAEDLGVGDRIEWTGSLPHDDALAALAACDVLASPHVPLADVPFFGSPMKIFEYMAIGRPIVASRLEQLDEVLEDGRTAKLVAPGDVADLAAGIEAVLALPDRGEALGRAAREEALREHTWERRAAEVLDALVPAERVVA